MPFLAIPGFAELWPILLIVVVLFGAKKLPELARAMGSSVNQFKKGLSEEASRAEELPEGSADEKVESSTH
jgi:sec-independent protein translocase protein TatA